MATYTVDLFTTLDGFGTGREPYWGKEGPQLLDQRARTYGEGDQTLVFGANTYRLMLRFAPAETDPSNAPLNAARKLIISRTLEEPLEWANSTLIAEDALDAVPRLKAESPVPLRSHGSIAMNRALLAADLVDRLEVMVFPAIAGTSGEPGRPSRYRPGARRLTALRRARAATRLRPDSPLRTGGADPSLWDCLPHTAFSGSLRHFEQDRHGPTQQ